MQVESWWGVGSGDGDFIVLVDEVVSAFRAGDDREVDGAAVGCVDPLQLASNMAPPLLVDDSDRFPVSIGVRYFAARVVVMVFLR